MKSLLIALLAASTCLAGPVAAEAYKVQDVQPTLQTPILTEADMDADADDPAIYANAADPARSLVIAAVKNGGMRVYALSGELVQTLGPSREDGRINNVDLVYGFTLANGEKVDLAIGSDRGLDVIRVWRIDATAAEPLVEVTDPAEPRAFPKRPTKDQAGSEDNPLDDQDTIYGLAAWTDRDSGLTWIAGTQRHQPLVGLFTLQALPEGKVGAKFERSVLVPGTHKGQDLFQEAEDEPLKDWSPQFEGSVVDATTGILCAVPGGCRHLEDRHPQCAGGTATGLRDARFDRKQLQRWRKRDRPRCRGADNILWRKRHPLSARLQPGSGSW